QLRRAPHRVRRSRRPLWRPGASSKLFPFCKSAFSRSQSFWGREQIALRSQGLGGHAQNDLAALVGGRLPSPYVSYGVVSSFSSVSTTNTASSLAGSVLLAFSLTLCRSPGISEKLCPARYVTTGPSLTELRIAPSRTVAYMKADFGCVWADDVPPGPYSTSTTLMLLPGTFGRAC